MSIAHYANAAYSARLASPCQPKRSPRAALTAGDMTGPSEEDRCAGVYRLPVTRSITFQMRPDLVRS